MGMDDLQRSNEPANPGRWQWSHRLKGGTHRDCALCPRTIPAGADIWQNPAGQAAHQSCAQQANRRAAASEAI